MRISNNRSVSIWFGICLLSLSVIIFGCGSDETSEPTVVLCSITELSAGGGITWLTGEPVSIRWAHTGTPKTVLIEALKGEEVVGIIAESSANDGYHSWSASTKIGRASCRERV